MTTTALENVAGNTSPCRRRNQRNRRIPLGAPINDDHVWMDLSLGDYGTRWTMRAPNGDTRGEGSVLDVEGTQTTGALFAPYDCPFAVNVGGGAVAGYLGPYSRYCQEPWVDFTVRLVGIEIQDQNGNPVPGCTITSVQSGHDCSFLIPEPATLALLAVGTLVAARRRRG